MSQVFIKNRQTGKRIAFGFGKKDWFWTSMASRVQYFSSADAESFCKDNKFNVTDAEIVTASCICVKDEEGGELHLDPECPICGDWP